MIDRDDSAPAFDVFISYALTDKDVVAPFVTALRRDGFEVWIDYEQMAGGVPVLEQLADGISRSAHMIVCLSDAYLQRDWTKAELDISVTRDPGARGARTIPAVFRPLTVEIPPYIGRLTICDLTNQRNDYDQQYALVTRRIRRRVTSAAPGKEAIGQICATPFGHADQPERALFEAYRAYRELCQFLYRQEIGDIPQHVEFSWITDRLMMRSSLPAEIRDSLATMEGYGRQVVPGYVSGAAVTAETIESPLKTLAMLTQWVLPDWHRPDEVVDVWDALPSDEDGTRQLPGTDYVLSAPVLGRAALGRLFGARDTSRDKPVTVLLVEPPPEDERAFRRHVARFEHGLGGGVLQANDGGELVVKGHRLHYLAMPAIDGTCAASLGELSPRSACELVLGVAEALRGLHETEPPVVHGDVVLANVVVGALGTVKLCPGRPIAETRAEDLRALAALLEELSPGPLAGRLASCTTAARACQILRVACRDLPQEDSLASVYRRYRNATTSTTTGPRRTGRATQLVETCRIESNAAWPLGDGRLVVWERGTDTLVVREGEETVWRDTSAVRVRRVAHGPAGRLAIGGWDGAVRCFSCESPVVSAQLDGAVGDLCFVGDSLVAGSWRQQLWRFAPDGQRHELLDVKAGVHRIAAAATRDRFAVADLSGGLAIYADNRRVANMPAVGFVTDLAYAGTRLVLLTGETLTSLWLDGSTGVGEARPGARRLLPGPAPGHCTLVVETSAGTETWLIDEADRHVRDRVFPLGHQLIGTCGGAGRFVVSDPDGGCAYWRDGEQQTLWRNAASATLSGDGGQIAVSRPGVVELYEDFA
ncbi:TIR domain-containing protein [Lentzea sp. NPDC054927]